MEPIVTENRPAVELANVLTLVDTAGLMAKKKTSSNGMPFIILLIAAILIVGLLFLLKDQQLPVPQAGTRPAGSQQREETADPAQPQRKWGKEIVPEPGDLPPPPEVHRESLATLSRDKAYAGFPRPTDDDLKVRLLENTAYATGYSDERKNPLWTAYKLVPDRIGTNLKRPKNFTTDDRTLARVRTSDFSHTGYERGHMAPNSPIADCWGQKAQLETFLLSNICPQSKALNEEVWENMERTEATRYSKSEPVWVICGPLFSDKPTTIKNGVQIPERFYRIVIRERSGKPDVMAFDVPQTVKGNEKPDQFLTTVSDIQSKSHLDFMWELPDDIENNIEAKKSAAVW